MKYLIKRRTLLMDHFILKLKSLRVSIIYFPYQKTRKGSTVTILDILVIKGRSNQKPVETTTL